jgi:PTH1 family peptidyl-tRNA hydrolase
MKLERLIKGFRKERNGKVKIIVGLGNPGSQYEETRHNIGYKVLDELSKRLQIPLSKQKFKSIYGISTIDGEQILLVKPLTYMNLSGEAVAALARYFKASGDELVVIYDDLDLPVGKLRLRSKGSAGGHNGMKSIIAHLGTENFNRIRVGIGRPEPGISVPDHVLKPFLADEREEVRGAIQRSSDACEEWLSKPFIQVMNHFNS